MPKVCFFDFNINFGGAPIGSVSLCSGLIKQNVDVKIYDVYGKNDKYINFIEEKQVPFDVISPESKRVYIEGGVVWKRCVSFLIQLPDFVKIAFRTRRMLKRDEIELVWVNNSKSLALISVASLGLGIKKVLYHRGWAQSESISFFFFSLIKYQCSTLIAHSHATVGNLKSLFPHANVVYVPNSVSLRLDICEAPRRLGNDFKILLPAARPVREKGHHVAVKALSRVLHQSRRRVVLHFPGEIAVGVDDSYMFELRRLIKSSHLIDNVEFTGWLDNLQAAIHEADVVILPSHTEGFPRVIIEAMLLKVPVIATPVGGIPEAIFHEETGLIVDMEDPDSLADAIMFIMENPVNVARITENAHSFAKRYFSPETQVKEVKEAFYGVLDHE